MADTLTTLRAAKSALEMQQTGLQWYRGMMPEYVDGSDDEADAETSSAITDLRTLIASMEAQPTASPVMLKVVRGDICCKSLDMDQSYGMWVPVTYSAEHGFVDGTCFYTTAQPSEPKAEPACILCHGKGEYEMASAWLPGQPPQEKRMVKCRQCAQPKAEPLAQVRPVTFGGCPSCGSQMCIARSCVLQPKAEPCRCEPSDYLRPAGYDGDGSVAALAKAAQPKAEPAHDDLTIAYLSGFHDGRKAKTELVQAPSVSVQWLAEMIMSDCGCSTNNQSLLGRIAKRIEDHARANTATPQGRKPLSEADIQTLRFEICNRTALSATAAAMLTRAVERAHGIEGGAA